MNLPKQIPRLLLIEDNDARINQFREWLPENMVLVVAASAGRAIGTLQHSDPYDYAGILLDHDLDQQVVNADELLFTGSNVVGTLIAKISNEIPVLVHSINFNGASNMRRKLEKSGFEVTTCPMTRLTREQFSVWLKDVLELWECRQEE